jgi:hypothetical protein
MKADRQQVATGLGVALVSVVVRHRGVVDGGGCGGEVVHLEPQLANECIRSGRGINIIDK